MLQYDILLLEVYLFSFPVAPCSVSAPQYHTLDATEMFHFTYFRPAFISDLTKIERCLLSQQKDPATAVAIEQWIAFLCTNQLFEL